MNEQTKIEASPFRMSTDAAHLCKEVVLNTAATIHGRRHVTVEGWQAIAIAHGCQASVESVSRVSDEGASGFSAIATLRRFDDGSEISRAEGFLGDDERVWAKRDTYAKRAMAQTRAISRVCRTVFGHVVNMMDEGLATTPAEEMPDESEAPRHDPETGEIHGDYSGPDGGKTALRKRAHNLRIALQGVDDMDGLKRVWGNGKDLVDQLEREWPDLLTGVNGDDIGIIGEKEAAKARAGMSETAKWLLSSLDTVETKAELADWLDEHGEKADDLNDVERAIYEDKYNQKDAGLTAAANLNAG